jgi:sec-independent protein translocase protein TatB
MFDIGWPELMLIMVVALVVIGPKDLPAAIRTVTTILRKMRGMAAEFRGGLEDIAREAGVDEVKRSIDDAITYDAKAALENIAQMDGGEFDLDLDELEEQGNRTSDNSILDPAIQSQMFNDDPDAAPVAADDPADDENSTTADEDDGLTPRPAAPATGTS